MTKPILAISLLASPIAMVLLANFAPAPAEARSPMALTEVTACSRYGNGCASAPVRTGRFGHELRLKGGTWIDCKSDCRQTLREETVDFWDTQREKNGGRH